MAWTDTGIAILRVLINDLTNTPTYSDATLTKLLLVGAIYTIQDITFDITYTVDFTLETITPDPVSDTAFMNFIIMKAACQADISTFRTHALQEGITARCGPAVLSVVGKLKGFKELLTVGPCAAYESMKIDYIFGSGDICRAIMSPFISNNFDPDSLAWIGSTYYTDTRNVNSAEEYFT